MSDSRQFVYLVEGEPYIGDVHAIASAMEHSHYAGLDVSKTVWHFVNGQPIANTVSLRGTDFDENDYAYVTISIPSDVAGDPYQATYRVDGRA